MLVDDDPRVLSILEQALTQCGHQVLVADCATEALHLHEVEQGGIDLLITDMKMPEMSGPELARQLRQFRPDLRIVFISGNPSAESQLRDAGFTNYTFVAKPFIPSEFVKRLPRLFES